MSTCSVFESDSKETKTHQAVAQLFTKVNKRNQVRAACARNIRLLTAIFNVSIIFLLFSSQFSGTFPFQMEI